MPDKMLKFVKIGQQNPPKREVLKRKEKNQMGRSIWYSTIYIEICKQCKCEKCENIEYG